MYVLGINAYHGDVSAVLLQDGQLVIALEEERFRRIKHWAGFPTLSIQRCLEIAGITGDRCRHVAISRDPRANLLHKATVRADEASESLDRARSPQQCEEAARCSRAARRCARRSARQAADAALRGASSVASRERVLRLAVRRCRDLRDRWLRRLRQHVDGAGEGQSLRRAREGLFPAFARDALHRRHAVPRLHGLRRRVQDHGARAVRGTGVRRASCASS